MVFDGQLELSELPVGESEADSDSRFGDAIDAENQRPPGATSERPN
jgi:hypothetical protein